MVYRSPAVVSTFRQTSRMDAPNRTIVWFRRDLRVADHPALSAAADRGEVVALFVLDPALLTKRHHTGSERLTFLRAGLEALDSELQARGTSLTVRSGDPRLVIPDLAREVGADHVHITREISGIGRARDGAVAEALASQGAALLEFGGDLVVEPSDLPGSSGAGYQVFTPFYRAWQEHPLPPHDPGPTMLTGPALVSDGLGALPTGEPLIPAGPAAAREKLAQFVRSGAVEKYGARRNAVAEVGTSQISPYLRFGMCTGAQIGRALRVGGELPSGRGSFWRQVAWREFFHHLAARRPEVLRQALREDLRDIQWNDDDDGFAAWKAGQTGYPIVDAAMRQLLTTGWMHNRTRMVVASFLVKDLLIDWRRGETHFMQHLLDGDPASNNGGWQWVAGTGADAAPYFRVFNPTLQGQKFDPHGTYVRRYVAELAAVPTKRIHEPWLMTDGEQVESGCRIGTDYPAPIVDHRERRAEVLDRYRAAREAAGAPESGDLEAPEKD